MIENFACYDETNMHVIKYITKITQICKLRAKNVPLYTSKLENVPKVTDKIAISRNGHVSHDELGRSFQNLGRFRFRSRARLD